MAASLQELISLQGKTAIVTGGAQGIGGGVTERLHEAGANVVIADMDEATAVALAKKLNTGGDDTVTAVKCDVSRTGDVQAVVDKAIAIYGGVDILVNNAGIFPFAPLADITDELFDKVYAVNLRGTHNFVKLVAAHMRETGRKGRIVNICSIDALHPSSVGLAVYDASKHGLWGYTKNVALELVADGIIVNGVAPGGIATPGVAAMQGGEANADEIAGRDGSEISPLGRWGVPDDIAKATLFLCTELATNIVGELLVVDGGTLLR